MWILGWLDELESDFSAIHRIDDIYVMSGPRFFKFANNMMHYQGAIRFNAERQAMELQNENGSNPVVGDDDEALYATKEQIMARNSFKAIPELGQPAMFEFVEVKCDG